MSKLPGLEFEPRTIYGIGRNYAEHARELGNPLPTRPIVFLKPLSSLSVGARSFAIPALSKEVHHEVEIVVAIGRGGRDIAEKDALSHVAGYAVGIDFTARDLQEEAKKGGLPWALAKGLPGFAQLGPFVRAESVSDPSRFELELSINGETRQKAGASLMLFPIPKLIAFLSQAFSLEKGDLIYTGTPAGVGPVRASNEIMASMSLGDAGSKLSEIQFRVS